MYPSSHQTDNGRDVRGHSGATLHSRHKEPYFSLFSDNRGGSSTLPFSFHAQCVMLSSFSCLHFGVTKIAKIRQNSYLCIMKKLLCPQCKIAAMYVKNKQGDRLPVYVSEDGEVIPKYPEDSMEGFDLTEVFCLGCSWHGSPKRLLKR